MAEKGVAERAREKARERERGRVRKRRAYWEQRGVGEKEKRDRESRLMENGSYRW